MGVSERQASITVDMGTPSVLATLRQLSPVCRSLRASSRRKTRLGRPRACPLAFAARWPARTRSRMTSRSIWANAAKMCNMNRLMGLSWPVSIPSEALRNRTSWPTSSWIVRTQWATLRPQRSSFQTKTASKRPCRASARSRSICGRLAFCAAHTRIYIFFKDLPASVLHVEAQFVELHAAALVAGADAGIESYLHGNESHESL